MKNDLVYVTCWYVRREDCASARTTILVISRTFSKIKFQIRQLERERVSSFQKRKDLVRAIPANYK